MVDKNKRTTQGERGLSSFKKGEAEAVDAANDRSAATQAPVVEASWDPYQVWLTRVKQPREQSARKRRQARAVAEQPSSPDLSETARLRALTITR